MKKNCAVCDKKFHGRGGLCLRCYATYLSIETFTTAATAARSLREALAIREPAARLGYLQMQFRKTQFLTLLVNPGQGVPARNKPVTKSVTKHRQVSVSEQTVSH
jgi:hypothetical protein